MGLHLRTHPEVVEGCFGCKAMGLTIYGVSPDVTKGQGRSDRSAQKKWDKELNLYQSARNQGVQPKSTKTRDIQAALDKSDVAGRAWDASANAFVG